MTALKNFLNFFLKSKCLEFIDLSSQDNGHEALTLFRSSITGIYITDHSIFSATFGKLWKNYIWGID